MSSTLDTLLVLLAVLSACGYLLWRRMRSRRQIERDWSSGRAESCAHCPAIEIRKQRAAQKPRSL